MTQRQETRPASRAQASSGSPSRRDSPQEAALSLVSHDLDSPLGLGLAAARAPRLPRPSASALFTWAAALAVLSGSFATALRERPWHPAAPLPVVAVDPPPEAAPAPVPPTPAQRSGPSIVRLDPDSDDSAAAKGVVIIRDPASVGQDLRLAHLPDRALLEDSPQGPLPMRSADGRRPFDAYRRAWSGARGARVAIVIGGLGLSQTGTQAAIAKLPPEITLAFAPSGNSLGRWMQAARRDGREIFMQLPLEPFDYPRVDPGRNTLTVEAGAAENAERLHWALGRTTNYAGVMNYMGARFTADRDAMRPLMEELGARGLAYLDDGSSARSAAFDLAAEARAPFAASDAAIDEKPERGAILAKLDELERIARAKGTALGTGSAFGTTVDTVAEWAQEARKRGIEIVPVSALAADPGQ